MLTRRLVRKALDEELDYKDPKKDGHNHPVINWPMKDFRHELFNLVKKYHQFKEIKFQFTKADIENELTTAILKTNNKTLRLVYDHNSQVVECFCIGTELEPVRKIVPIYKMDDFVSEYFPIKRVVVIKKH